MVKLTAIALCLFLGLTAYAADTRTINDILGRKVTLPSEIKSIVPLGHSIRYVSMLQAQDRVTGIEAIELLTPEKAPYLYVNKDLFSSLPIIGEGGPTRNTNIEALIKLKPDVIFIITTDAAEAEQLSRKTKIPVVALSYGVNGLDLNSIYSSLKLTGEILGKQKRANEVIGYIESLKKEFKVIHGKKREAYIGGIAYRGLQGLTGTQGNYFPFSLAGVVNIADKTGRKGNILVEKEYPLIMNPELLFIDSAGYPLIFAQAVSDKAYFKRFKAFEKGNAYLLLANTFYFANIDLMLINAFFIAKVAYPEYYGHINIREKADDIIEFFSGQRIYRVLEADSHGFKRIRLTDKGLVLEDITE